MNTVSLLREDGPSAVSLRGHGEWRLLGQTSSNPAANLALDEAVLQAAASGATDVDTARLWRCEPAAVVGRYQKVSAEVNLELCSRMGIPILRRTSGGGTVYLDKSVLVWSICTRWRGVAAFESPTRLFHFMGDCLVGTLREMGLRALFRPNAVYVKGRKVAGMAMHVKGEVALCHGTLLVQTDLDLLEQLLRPSSRGGEHGSRYTRSKREKVTSLARALSKPLSMAFVIEALTDVLALRLGTTFKGGVPTSFEEALAQRLAADKYARDEWNYLIP